MGRELNFTSTTKKAAKARQNHRCGICGQYLDITGSPYQGHHVVAERFGGDDSVNNCVVLCMERNEDGFISDGCHIYAHNDKYQSKFQLDKSLYPFFNG